MEIKKVVVIGSETMGSRIAGIKLRN